MMILIKMIYCVVIISKMRHPRHESKQCFLN